MEKNFWKLRTDSKQTVIVIAVTGFLIAAILGVKAYRDTELPGEYELQRNDAAGGAYEQELIVYAGEQKIPLTVTVKERVLSKEEADKEFEKAEKQLPDLLKGENESLSKVSKALHFVEQIPDSSVEVKWTEKQTDFFAADGGFKEDVVLAEAIELNVSAVLICQEYTRDFETVVTVLPREQGFEQGLMKYIQEESERTQEKEFLMLPTEYDGETLSWRKPLEYTFLYFLALTAGAVIFLRIGVKRDESKLQRDRLEELEKDYAQIVSKFAMLLSAGLSLRNAWERIVLMQKRKGAMEKAVYQEMSWGLHEMQKGVSELEVYEKFGIRIREVHYKKLMALFISDKKRGSIPLLDAMNQEMLSAWEERKRKTRQQGEKIGTKLLIPMMGMLGVVFVMILMPAFLSFGL